MSSDFSDGADARPHYEFLADCRARIGMDLLSHSWNGVVIYALDAGPRRPGELRTAIGGISAKVLTQTLRRLEGYGLVQHRRYAEAPPRVEYELTALGRTLIGPLGALARWSWEHGDAIVAAQERSECHAGANE